MMVATCLGVTLWLLESPDRLWPWLVVGYAALAGASLVTISDTDGWPAAVQAVIGLVLLGGAFYYVGERLLELEYSVLRWVCWVVAGAHALNAAVRIVAASVRKSKPSLAQRHGC